MSERPWPFLALVSAGIACWLERQGTARIEYLNAENRALRARLGGRRILLTDAERRTLGSLAKEVGRKSLSNLGPIVIPATLLRWHRELVAKKCAGHEPRAAIRGYRPRPAPGEGLPLKPTCTAPWPAKSGPPPAGPHADLYRDSDRSPCRETSHTTSH
jgi:hypothetical protein